MNARLPVKSMKRPNKRKFAVSGTALLTVAIFIAAFGNKLYGDTLRSLFANKTLLEFDTAQDFVRIMDVGQGDGILIYSNGCSALIDTGLTDTAEKIADELDCALVTDIDAVLITHLHMDHAGGLSRLALKFPIDNLILPRRDVTAEAAEIITDAERSVSASRGNVLTAVEGMNFQIGEFEITVIAYFPNAADENNRSIVTMAKIGDKKFLLTGDAGSPLETDMLESGLLLDCDVLKVAHHGSSSSCSEEFLAAASPEYAAISVGKNNTYSHPTAKTLKALSACGAEVYRTDTDGDITFFAEQGEIRVETENRKKSDK